MKIILAMFLLFIFLVSFNSIPAFANPSGQDNWDVSQMPPNKNYIDSSIKISACQQLNLGNDTDGDGICDIWENGTYGQGLHIRFNQNNVAYSYDLSCNANTTGDCPSPTHKDIYVELDWMQGHAPDPNVKTDVINAFKNSPTINPDNIPGINLHVQYGEHPNDASDGGDVGVHVTNLPVNTALWNTNPGFWVLKENRFGTVSERDSTGGADHLLSCSHSNGTSESPADCLTAKRQVFHYGVYIHNNGDPGASTSSGWAEIFGNDFVMSLGSFAGGTGSIDDQEASFMHELGHNLNLDHGGKYPPPDANNNGITANDKYDEEADNCKPNYLSVMSYTYEFRSTEDACRPLDYSSKNMTVLDEHSQKLNDSNIGSYPYPVNYSPPSWLSPVPACFNNISGKERPIFYTNSSGGIKSSTTGVITDWNGDGIRPRMYSQHLDLNRLSVAGGCNPSPQAFTILKSHDDWNGGDMKFNFMSSALSTTIEGNSTIPSSGAFCDSMDEHKNETSCVTSTDIDLETITHDRLLKLSNLNDSVNAMPNNIFVSAGVDKNKILSNLDSAINANSNNDIWRVVHYLDLIDKTIGTSTTRTANLQHVSPIQNLTDNVDQIKSLYLVAGTTTTVNSKTTPPTPTDLKIDSMPSGDKMQVNLSWNLPDYFGPVVTGYQIERNDGSGFTPISENTVTTSYSDLVPSGNYIYRVYAISDAGNGSAIEKQCMGCSGPDYRYIEIGIGVVIAVGIIVPIWMRSRKK